MTRLGKRIAVLISSEEYDRLTLENHPSFWEALQTFRQQVNLAEIGIGAETKDCVIHLLVTGNVLDYQNFTELQVEN